MNSITHQQPLRLPWFWYRIPSWPVTLVGFFCAGKIVIEKLSKFLLIVLFKNFIYLFLEKGRDRKRERNINLWLPLLHHLLVAGPQPRHVHWLGIKPVTLCMQASTQSTRHASQGYNDNIFLYVTPLKVVLTYILIILYYRIWLIPIR